VIKKLITEFLWKAAKQAADFSWKTRIKNDAYVSSRLPGGGNGGKVCCIQLHLVDA